ncbi:efflux RND transporter periplasmic adaptor subunit [Methylocaldum szegediense]|uniref:efflux RND transporter periplasmic adaptor subunit n=1 Tax=Methylocaldum szegediense TaxID=73780 RepID=UPI0003F7C0BC|nr:efflux RND transporter periplasmic adaptor subunit [Methylocaldum szegediense]
MFPDNTFRRITLWLGLFAVLAALLIGCGGQSDAPAAEAEAPPVKVKVAQPLQKEVLEWDEYTGRIEAMETVEVRARIDGYLDKVNFKAGDKVKKGDLLFVIDPRPYQAELKRAEGELERARARLELAKNDLQRAEHLRRAKAISEEEYDARSKGQREAAAAVRAAEAAAQMARLNLEFTEIRAPISGRIGREFVTRGNLVSGGGAGTLLTIIVSVDPVYVYVDADERAVLKYRRLAEAGKRTSARETRITAKLALIDESDFPHEGYIDYIDPRMDPSTGTLRARAVFSNPNEFLSPGFFARLRVPGSAPYQGLLVPDRAVGTDQGQKFVWVAKDDGSVEYRRIVPGTVTGQMRVISEGLQPDDWVVIEGVHKLSPGTRIEAERIPLAAIDGSSS